MINFLNEDRYKIDVSIPLHSMKVRLKDEPARVYRKAYNEWKEKLSSSVTVGIEGDLSGVYFSLGGLNKQVIDPWAAAFALIEVGPYHKGLQGRQIYLECSMRLLNTPDGRMLNNLMGKNLWLNNLMGKNLCKISYYMRGFVEFDDLGEIDKIEFDQVTATCALVSAFSTEIRKIFNDELYKLCPPSIQETFDNETIYAG